jgi:uncharacterized membrane protein
MELEIEPHEERIQHRRRAVKSYRAKADKRRTGSERFADLLTKEFGTVFFLTVNAIWFLAWIAINTGQIPGIAIFDPYPFGFLTMVVSLEAIFLAIIVLISQNRAAKIAEIREEVDLQVNSITEGEVTKVIALLMLLLEKNGINVDDDPDLKVMLKPVKSAELERTLENQLK